MTEEKIEVLDSTSLIRTRELEDPDQVLAEAQKRAQALKKVVDQKKNPVIFNNERYLEFDDWQTLANFYGITVKTQDPEYVKIGDVEGAKARAVAINIKTGLVIGGAESWCMRDEKNWNMKPWFQLASMAQTRAGAKTLRNILSWVVVLAGYKPTPAEEMTGMESKSEKAETKTESTKEPHKITEPQRKRLFAIYKTAGYTDDQVKAWLKKTYGIESSKDILMDYYEDLCSDIQNGLVPK